MERNRLSVGRDHRRRRRVTPPSGSAAVLIVAPATDLHALTVEHVLRESFGAEVLLWDTAGVAQGDGLTFRTAPGRLEVVTGGHALDLVSVRSAWWRRPHGFGLTAETLSTETLRFCEREYTSLLLGGLAGSRATVVNCPHAEAAAQRKPLQLATAEQVGLPVPETIISNNIHQVKDFWKRLDGNCVYKTLTPTPGTFRETRRLRQEDLSDLRYLSLAPIIVQRCLTGVDLRVTVMGRRQFAAVARTDRPEAAIDWRVDLTCRWEPYVLDPQISRRLRDLLTALGLHYGCIDLRLCEDGVPYFLEVNPSGQFLFVEADTAQPIVEAMCLLLLDPTSAWEPEP